MSDNLKQKCGSLDTLSGEPCHSPLKKGFKLCHRHKKDKSKLKFTPKQKRLIEELAKPDIKSVRSAAIKAGYAESTASTIVYQTLENTRIKEAVQNRINRALKHHKVTPEEVLGSAVFQMRSSMADILDDDGSFDYQKAKDTGAVDLLKKHKETTRTIQRESGNEIIKTVEVELQTNQDARKEVANYIGLEKFSSSTPDKLTDKELAAELFNRLIQRGFEPEDICKSLEQRFPTLAAGAINRSSNK